MHSNRSRGTLMSDGDHSAQGRLKSNAPTVKKWVIATEPIHLNNWFIQELNIVMLLRDVKQCCSCLELFFCWQNGTKTGNMVSKT